VCLGYSQIPGVDYSDNYAPVENDSDIFTKNTTSKRDSNSKDES